VITIPLADDSETTPGREIETRSPQALERLTAQLKNGEAMVDGSIRVLHVGAADNLGGSFSTSRRLCALHCAEGRHARAHPPSGARAFPPRVTGNRQSAESNNRRFVVSAYTTRDHPRRLGHTLDAAEKRRGSDYGQLTSSLGSGRCL
jgi:hypothetical protein